LNRLLLETRIELYPIFSQKKPESEANFSIPIQLRNEPGIPFTVKGNVVAWGHLHFPSGFSVQCCWSKTYAKNVKKCGWWYPCVFIFFIWLGQRWSHLEGQRLCFAVQPLQST